MKYKHKALQSENLIGPDQLDKEAAKGWLLLSIVPVLDTFYYYFRKENELDS